MPSFLPSDPTAITDLIDRVRDLTGLLSIQLLPSSTITKYLDEVYAEVIDSADWPFLEAEQYIELVPGQDTYVLPRSVNVLSIASIGNRPRVLSPVLLEQLRDRRPRALTGIPLEYALVPNGIDTYVQIYPVPNSAETFVLRFRKTASTLLPRYSNSYFGGYVDLDSAEQIPHADTVGEIIFERRFHPVLAYGVATRLLAREADNTGRVQLYQQEYEALVKRMREHYIKRYDRGQLQLGGRGDQRKPHSRRRWW